MIGRAALLPLMDNAETVYLATVAGSAPRIRALENLRRADRYPGASDFCRAAGFTLYFATSRSSDKVREIRANPAVAVYYCIPPAYHGVMLTGTMEIVDDVNVRKALWQKEWDSFWPGGTDNPEYLVLRLAPTEASGWWYSETFHFAIGGA